MPGGDGAYVEAEYNLIGAMRVVGREVDRGGRMGVREEVGEGPLGALRMRRRCLIDTPIDGEFGAPDKGVDWRGGRSSTPERDEGIVEGGIGDPGIEYKLPGAPLCGKLLLFDLL